MVRRFVSVLCFVVLLVVCVSSADARCRGGGCRVFSLRNLITSNAPVSVPVVESETSAPEVATNYGRTPAPAPTPEAGPLYRLALERANEQARRFACGHWLGCPSGCWEGAGMAPDEASAIRNCCFWGRRPVKAIATATRNGRWFATVLYD